MCGVPVHAADQYLERLIRAGHRVAVCEQIEDPAEARKRGSKSVVRRDVVRLVTPGTLTEESAARRRASNNFIAALARVKSDDALALAWADISSGEFVVMPVKPDRLAADLAGLEPGEIIVPDGCMRRRLIARCSHQAAPRVTPLPASRFDSARRRAPAQRAFRRRGTRRLRRLHARRSLGARRSPRLRALTQVGRTPALPPAAARSAASSMIIDAATRANLELDAHPRRRAQGQPSRYHRPHRHAPPARGFSPAACRSPLTDPAAINARLDAVAYFAARARRCARRCASALRTHARYRARLVAPDARPRRPARSRGPPRRARRRRRSLPALLRSAATASRAVPGELATALPCSLTHAAPTARRRSATLLARRAAAPRARRRLRRARLFARSSTSSGACATRRARSSPACRRAMPARPASSR